MKIRYDKHNDSLSIALRKASYRDSEEVQPNIVFDFDKDGKVMAIDIDHASEIVDIANLPTLA